MGERSTYGITARYRVVLMERLGGLFFDGGRSCVGDSFRWSFGSVPLRVSRGEYKVTKGVSGRGGVFGHAADFLLFSKRTATGPSCGKSIQVPHLRALRGCSLVSSTASTATNER